MPVILAVSVAVVAAVIVAVVVVVALGFALTAAMRNRSAKSEWIGELSDIRMSSLGDDDEVTGALEAINVDDDHDLDPDGEPADAAPVEGAPVEDAPVEGAPDVPAVDASTGETVQPPATSPLEDPAADFREEVSDPVVDSAAEEPAAEPPTEDSDRFADETAESEATSTVSDLRPVTNMPDRTVDDAGVVFYEYDRPDGALLRIEATDPTGLRVLVGQTDTRRATCAVDLPRGVLWHRGASGAVSEACSIRTPSGWVTTTGTLLVLVDATGWTYAMCLSGVATAECLPDGAQRRLATGEIGRGRVGTVGFEITTVGPDALESEGAVRRQRRLDGSVD
jgi:hypothetical protein